VVLDANGNVKPDDARKGLGGVFSLTDPAKINQLQHIAVDQSRLHIPILFAFDTIHGFKTIFPIPLGQASSFDPDVAATDDTIAARESAASGIKQIYSPMVDVSHEPRWGRIAGDDVVQLYIHDPVASIVQPVRRLRGFQRVTLQSNEMKPVTFTLGRDDVGFYDNTGKFVVEPGAIDVFANDRSTGREQQTFRVTAG